MTVNNQAEFDPFSEETMEIVSTVESLPDLKAFEHLMYVNRLNRKVTYEMAKPLTLRPLPPAKGKHAETHHGLALPESLSNLLPLDSEVTIANLVAEMEEPYDSMLAVLWLDFTANGTLYHIVSSQTNSVCYVSRDDRDLSYRYNTDIAGELLKAFLFNREYAMGIDTHIDDPRIADLRTPLAEDAERAILTLGQLDGYAVVETTALFSTPSAVIEASLREGEIPTLNNVDNDILQTDVETIDDISETSIHQTLQHAAGNTAQINFAKIMSGNQKQDINPATDYAAWAKVCREFYATIATQLASFKYLD